MDGLFYSPVNYYLFAKQGKCLKYDDSYFGATYVDFYRSQLSISRKEKKKKRRNFIKKISFVSIFKKNKTRKKEKLNIMFIYDFNKKKREILYPYMTFSPVYWHRQHHLLFVDISFLITLRTFIMFAPQLSTFKISNYKATNLYI